ncbi:MAG: 50S ribosomal protein L3 N(5)-glutamine methyltransferase [Hyphomicrobiaceae bacterium]
MSDQSPALVQELITVRDWLRYGVTRFSQAGLVFGHGTQSAIDEAAFLILMALHLPVDQLEPWLDARLTTTERTAIAALFDKRIETRKPASYLVNAAFIRGHRFYVDDRVIVPRSYIGELLEDGLAAVIDDPAAITSVLDVCTGSGCLAILAALTFENARVDAVELSPLALQVALRNVTDYRLHDRVRLVESDLFSALPKDARYDLIIANPPYVAAAEVASFDPEYRAEPVMAHIGGTDGLDLVRTILAEASAHLTPHGVLIVEIGTGREALEAAYPGLDFFWLDTANSEGEVFALTADALNTQLAPAKSRRRR